MIYPKNQNWDKQNTSVAIQWYLDYGLHAVLQKFHFEIPMA